MGLIKAASLFVVIAFCLFSYALRYHSKLDTFFCVIQASFLRYYAQWLFYIYLGVWSVCFIICTFSLDDVLLIGLISTFGFAYAHNYEAAFSPANAFIMLTGLTLGRGAQFLLQSGNVSEIRKQNTEVRLLLIGLIALLAFLTCWHLDMSGNSYHGPRRMGLWDNPNTYGMLMGAGGVLAAGLLAAQRSEDRGLKSEGKAYLRRLLQVFLFIAAGMLGVGLVMSYSRGAWVATSIGLLYLAWSYGKLKWRHIVIGSSILVLGAGVLWGRTHDSAPWYVKRADLGRPSAQNRATAWRAGLEIMRDHPLGVGWNNATKIYGEKYHPPEGGPAAITTNDYMMIGTELGIPALLCFVAYMGLCYRKSPRLNRTHLTPALSPFGPSTPAKRGEGESLSVIPQTTSLDTCHASHMQEQESFRAACLAGALVFVVAFWFDGGLFKLPTAAMFWVLLELGAYRSQKVESAPLANK